MGLTHVTVRLGSPARRNGAFEADFLVDTGTTDCLAAASKLRRAGIKPAGKTAYELADGTVHEYEFGLAQIEFMGEIKAGRVTLGPDDPEPNPRSHGLGVRGHNH